tara:strand:- start:2473 stop:2826 length:354 start_codon:yes stop_codon:yes gene_type:complete
MRNKFDFRQPLAEEPDGTYITAGQMQFWLNRKEGKEMFSTAHPAFLSYYNKCRVYNLVYDLMEEDEGYAIMYWDSEKESISVGFPSKGPVAYALSTMSFAGETDEYEDGEDSWSAGL